MEPVAALLHKARQRQRESDLPQAERLCRQALEADPACADGWQLLAAILRGHGKSADAAAAYRELLRLRPHDAEPSYQLGLLHAEQGDVESAAASYRHALTIDPRHADALINLGILLAERGNVDEAVGHWREAIRWHPKSARAHYNLGVALARQGQADEAGDCLGRALEIQPDYPAAHYARGNLLGSQGRKEEAVVGYREALRLKPDYADACNNLGLALFDLNRAGEAAVILRHGARLRPALPEAHNNLGLALAALGRFSEAEAAYEQALRLNPRYAEAHNNLASAWKEQGRLEEAVAGYEIALWLQPDSASTHWNRALAWLQAGDFRRGWAEYEWRWKRGRSAPRRFRQPAWDGSAAPGQTVLIYQEQGLGDMIQFIRYAALVKQRAAAVIVECPASLIPLFSTCPGIDRLVAEGTELPPFDVHTPLLSLPALLGTTLESIPADVPYLTAEPERVGAWARVLDDLPGFKVGIAWQGNPRHPWDRHRSIPLACFAPLARLPGVRLISLQKGPGAEQTRALANRLPIAELPGPIDEDGAFVDTAAIISRLDLVVAADTAVAHLAGALGKPVWLALSKITDWRWLLEREDSPWYPNMRLFRQERLGDWRSVMERMAAELRQRVPLARSEPGS
jgi:tetratricopeptide (TPR) repeat protein